MNTISDLVTIFRRLCHQRASRSGNDSAAAEPREGLRVSHTRL